MKVIAVDAGKFATKGVAADGSKILFRTKSTQLTDSLDIDAAGNSNKVIEQEDQSLIDAAGFFEED